jgi:hypothetical protein
MAMRYRLERVVEGGLAGRRTERAVVEVASEKDLPEGVTAVKVNADTPLTGWTQYGGTGVEVTENGG